jgi:hypothetical protein
MNAVLRGEAASRYIQRVHYRTQALIWLSVMTGIVLALTGPLALAGVALGGIAGALGWQRYSLRQWL